jgi:type II restriction/modification system DNA methylase subunit YeeA
MSLTPQDFVARWRQVTVKERSAAQSHFNDLCRLISHPTPIEDDPTGERFTFEAGAGKQAGGQGWADVWKRGFFAWEYKGKHADLDKAYQQLLQYREALENPPLLVVSDLDRIEIHTNFTNTVKQKVVITLDDLLTVEGMRHLRALFTDPAFFKSPETTQAVTEKAAREFARLAEVLRRHEDDPQHIAHFLIRLLFCLFAEDIDLLPKGLFTRLIERGRQNPAIFNRQLRQLFEAMAAGDFFGEHKIRHFDGGLFDSAIPLPLDREGLEIVAGVSRLDWSNIEPSILGTLFERSLDPSKRSQLGAHYTSKEDILLIVEPVLMAPLRRRWEAVKAEALALAQKRDDLIGEWQGRTDRTQAAKSAQIQSIRTQNDGAILALLQAFMDDIAAMRVLDPACGSGNFLYVSLRLLLDLQKEVITLAAEVVGGYFFPTVSPEGLFGIEINPYAHELAQATIWIGWIQWLHENGYGVPREPILKRLDHIKNMDAVLAYDAAGNPVEPVWPDADVIVGNPPFLGAQKLRRELTDLYVENLFQIYSQRIPGSSDLVCYWFEKARSLIQKKTVLQRAGLIATQAIRSGNSRRVLDEINKSGGIFMAWSDRPWILDGAAVRVSVIGFDSGIEKDKVLNGESVDNINPDLTSSFDLTHAVQLFENQKLCFRCDEKGGAFDISAKLAKEMLMAANPHGRPNSDVIRPYINASDVTGRNQNKWIVDFGVDMPLEKAALYEQPFEYILEHVKPERQQNVNQQLRDYWWLHRRTAPDMREAVSSLKRFIITPRVAKHRLFVYLDSGMLPDSRVYAIAREDDYFLGVLHSRIHEVWSLATSSRHGDGNEGGRPTYNVTTCFETFPFPWPPGSEPTDDPRVHAIAGAAQALVEKRDSWLNPPGLAESELKKRTLTNLYNAMPTWLSLAHETLDQAVFAAYGWPHDLGEEQILARLLALNLERAEASPQRSLL